MPDILTAIDVVIIRQEGQGEPQDVEAPALEFVHEQQQEFLEAAQLEPFVEDVALQGHAAVPMGARHRGFLQAVGGAELGHHLLDDLGRTPGGVGEEAGDRLPFHRPGDEVALQPVRAQPDRRGEVAMVVHTLSHHGFAEGMHRVDERTEIALHAEGIPEPAHQIDIELDGVVPGGADALVIGETRAEVIDQDPEVQFLDQPFRGGTHAVPVLAPAGGFREFEADARTVDLMFAQTINQLVETTGAGNRINADVHREVVDSLAKQWGCLQASLQAGHVGDHQGVDLVGDAQFMGDADQFPGLLLLQ